MDKFLTDAHVQDYAAFLPAVHQLFCSRNSPAAGSLCVSCYGESILCCWHVRDNWYPGILVSGVSVKKFYVVGSIGKITINSLLV